MNGDASWGRNSFETELCERGQQYLQELCDQGQSEHTELEFKANGSGGKQMFSANGELTKEGRRVLAKAISAMANTAGGLIVIGVECRRVDGVDCAQKLAPIPCVERARSSVTGVAHNITEFAVPGLDVRSISSDEYGSGFLAVLVPYSDARPHRANDSKDKTYYLRVADNSVAMPHGVMLDMARRKTRPKLDLDVSLHLASSSIQGSADRQSHIFNMQIRFYASNFSDESAKHIHLSLHHVPNPKEGEPLVLRAPDLKDLPQGAYQQKTDSPIRDIYYDSGFVVHRRQKRLLGYVIAELRIRDGAISSTFRTNAGAIQNSLELHATLNAEGAELVSKNFKVTSKDLHEAIGAPPPELL